MKKRGFLTVLLTIVFAFTAYAYIPDNSEENSFEERIVVPFFEVTELVKDGIKAIRQEVVSSSYDQERSTELSGGGLKEKEKGEENVTSKDVVFYEPKEEIYEAQEIMEEIRIWLGMYRTTHEDDVVPFKKYLKKYIEQKNEYLGKLIKAYIKILQGLVKYVSVWPIFWSKPVFTS